jgi:hypothetical protein
MARRPSKRPSKGDKLIPVWEQYVNDVLEGKVVVGKWVRLA